MRTRTKVILGVVLFFPLLVGISFVGGLIWGAIDPEGQEKARMQNEANKELTSEQQTAKLDWEKEQEWLGNQYVKNNPKQSAITLSETRYENMVLNYKGKDGKGFSIKDFSDARCGDNQDSFAGYLDDNFDGKSNYHAVVVYSPVNIDWNPPCLGASWHFGVNNQGDVIAWDYSAERQDILDYLDDQG